MQRIHFIAIGGAAMHNLAIALCKEGYNVTGSDDEIFEPSKSRLANYNLLPSEFGWFADKITTNIDAIVLGMHARQDNPELIRARELGLKIFSYPEFLYNQTMNKTRVVIGGSHGKTSTTAMIMHVLKNLNVNFDYMVGSQVEGFETMVKLSDEAKIAVFEGDEYLSSPIDLRPKFHLYQPTIGLITGIEWDHINVFPTFEIYKKQFSIFVDLIDVNGSLVYFNGDKNIVSIVESEKRSIDKVGYNTPKYEIEDGVTYVFYNSKKIAINVFGEHNLQNMEGARLVCNKLGVADEDFYYAISSFNGAGRRLQLLENEGERYVYNDFAHSPSKLRATVKAVSAQYPKHRIVACMELHTFSSLNKEFLSEYKDTMIGPDRAIVFFNPETVKHKRLPDISENDIYSAFNRSDLEVFSDSQKLLKTILDEEEEKIVFLLMSSGNFSGLDIKRVAQLAVKKV